MDGLTTPNGLLKVSFVLTLIDGLIMLYLASVTAVVILFAVSGLVLSLGYTAFEALCAGRIDCTRLGGDDRRYSLRHQRHHQHPDFASDAALCDVASVLIGKHTDKIENDRPVGVNSVPVLIGENRALALNKICFIAFYVLIVALVALNVTGVWILVTFLALPRLFTAWKVYSQPKPKQKPENWPVWPLWFVGWAMHFNRQAGGLFILGMILNLIMPPVGRLLGVGG
jgi:1,4-dihydroxy-2-naphthoate octaprenyltransferase